MKVCITFEVDDLARYAISHRYANPKMADYDSVKGEIETAWEGHIETLIYDFEQAVVEAGE